MIFLLPFDLCLLEGCLVTESKGLKYKYVHLYLIIFFFLPSLMSCFSRFCLKISLIFIQQESFVMLSYNRMFLPSVVQIGLQL